MGKLTETGSILQYLNTGKGVTIIAILITLTISIILISKTLEINAYSVIKKFLGFLLLKSSKIINDNEVSYERDLEIGKISNKSFRYKSYTFLNDLIIDLGLKSKGATPYEFLFICLIGSLILTLVACQLLFGNIFMAIIMFPIVFIGLICTVYTKANLAHDMRIENVIEAENTICSNIKDGVVKAVKVSLTVLPEKLQDEFKNFLEDIENRNYHVRQALEELNKRLGHTSNDFIKKCIVFETQEEHGAVGMFKDIVEINNSKMAMRTTMKRKFEEVTTDFIIGAAIIFVFLGGVIAIYPDVQHFYLKTPIGQIVIAIDLLILIGEFVYITYLRATEL